MNTIRTPPIVCGTDFSEAAAHAADVAAALAKKLGAPLLLVRGVDERGEIPEHYWERFIEADRPQLVEEAARLRATGAEIEERLVGGAPNDGVVKCAERSGARLVVVGSAGKGILDRWVLGSVAERIAETGAVPTLIVRPASPLQSWARGERGVKVFVGADFTPTSDAALRFVAELNQIGRCEITLCYVDRPADERTELALFDALNLTVETPERGGEAERDLRGKAQRLLGTDAVTVRVVPAAARIDEKLLRLAEESGADLIVVGTHQWNGLSRLRHSSVSRRMLRGARVSIACVPTQNGAGAQIPKVRRVLVATDLSKHGSRGIPHAYSLLGSGGAICLAHVAAPGCPHERYLEALHELIPATGAEQGIVTEIKVLDDNDAAQGICEAADRFGADLICVGSRGHSGLVATVLGSVARAVIARSTRPVLVVPPAP